MTRKRGRPKKEQTSSSSENPLEQESHPVVKFQLTATQDRAFEHLTNDQDINLLYGGAKGGGKTFLLCVWAYYWAKHLIELFKIDKPLKHPLPVGFLGRKQAVNFNDTTFVTWKKTIPADAYEIKGQEKEIIIDNRVSIHFGGLDDSNTVKKFNSMELAFIGIDQAEETDRTDIGELQASLRLRFNGVTPPYKRLWTANPAECWLKQDFILSPEPAGIYIPAKYTDNPHLPAGYGKTLEGAFSHDENLLRAYRDADWSAVRSSYTLIPSQAIEDLRGNTFVEYVTRDLVACDPSMGGDAAPVYRMRNTEIISERIVHERDTMKLVGVCDFMMREVTCYHFICDEIGIGAGVRDRMKELGWKVFGINSAAESSQPQKFVNLKAEMWFYVAELIKLKKCAYPKSEELRRQLSSVRFLPPKAGGRFQMEPKEVTRARIGRSPDEADTFVMGVWAKDHLHFGEATKDFKRHGASMVRTYQQTGLM